MPDAQKLVLFVCSGNTSRSVMAATWFRALCARRGLRGYVAVAAGINSPEGAAIAPEAVTVLAEHQLSPERLGSRRLTAKLVLAADLIVAMTDQHRDRIVEGFPRVRLRTVTLMSYAARGDLQVPDPANGGIEAYRACLAQMQPALAALADEFAEG